MVIVFDIFQDIETKLNEKNVCKFTLLELNSINYDIGYG